VKTAPLEAPLVSTAGARLRSTPAGEPPARLDGVYKSFGEIEALKGVCLKLERGETLALLGPNGAGKTTALGVALGIRRPDRGSATLFGLNPQKARARQVIGVTPQQSDFPGTLTVHEVIELVRAHYPRPLSVAEVLDRFNLGAVQRRQTGGLSGGQKRRLAVALAFTGNPSVVFLDEPTTGLDVESRHGLWEVLRDYVAAGGTILLTTHYLEEAEAMASRVALIDAGVIVAEGTVAEITERVALRSVRLRARFVPELPAVDWSERDGDDHVLYTRDSDAVVRQLVIYGVSFQNLSIRQASLEDAFLQLTNHSG
jgi:ABC-2 type transport system ATP-binding protein